MFDKSQFFEYPNQISRQINLPPGKTMKCGTRKCMMIIVPALAHRKNSYDEIIGGLIWSFEHLIAENMTNGIDAPCEIQSQE